MSASRGLRCSQVSIKRWISLRVAVCAVTLPLRGHICESTYAACIATGLCLHAVSVCCALRFLFFFNCVSPHVLMCDGWLLSLARSECLHRNPIFSKLYAVSKRLVDGNCSDCLHRALSLCFVPFLPSFALVFSHIRYAVSCYV